MRTYDTVTEAVSDLQKRGYDHNFNIGDNCLHCAEKTIFIHPEDFEVDEVHRFEGNTDPGDENVVYAISSEKYQIKGMLVGAFGVYTDLPSNEMLHKLRYHP